MLSFLSLKFYAFSGLVNFITALVISIIVLYKNPKTPVNRIFSIFSLSVAFWSFFYFIWLNATDKTQAEFYLRTCMMGVLFMPSLFIHFVDNLLQIKRNRKFYLLNYLLSISFTLTVYSPLYAHDISAHLVFPYWLRPGPVFHLAISHFATIIIYSFILMAKTISKTKGIIRNQLLYVFIGTAIGYIAGSTNYSCWYRLPIPPFLNIFVSVYVWFIAFAIAKYNLMGIDVAIKNFLARAFALVCLAVFVVGCVFILGKLLILTSPLLISLIATGLSVLFYPLSKKLEWWGSQAIRPRQNFEATFRRYTETELIESHNVKELADVIVKTVGASLNPQVCSLMLLDRQNNLYNVVSSSGQDDEIKSIAFKESNHLISTLKNSHKMRLIVKDELDKVLTEDQASLVRRDLEILNAQICLPLMLRGELVGLLNIGAKSSGGLYTPEEINFIFAFTTQSAMMIRFLEEIGEFEKKLVYAEKLAGIDEMLGSTNHELNNLISVIQSMTQILTQGQELSPEDRARAIQQILTYTQRAGAVTSWVSDYRRKLDYTETVEVDIGQAVDQAIPAIKEQLVLNLDKVQLIKDIPANFPLLQGKATLPDLFFHLLANSCYSMENKGGQLKISLKKIDKDYVELTITDTGGDIAKSMQRGPEYGGEWFAERSQLGGLSLFLARHITNDNQGTFHKPQSNQGRGAIFTVKLPLKQPKSE